MRALLDTPVILWWLADVPIAPAAAELIAEPSNVIFVSAASFWEASIKQSIGKLRVDGDLVAACNEAGFAPLPITVDLAAAIRTLPLHHRDPFDRMLITQAMCEELVLITRDATFADYDVHTLSA